MSDLEVEVEANTNKWRAQLAAARDETERQRRVTYDLQAEVHHNFLCFLGDAL